MREGDPLADGAREPVDFYSPDTFNYAALQPPTIQSLTVSPNTLWPPNHNMVPVTLTVAATDSCGIASEKIVSVTSNEPSDGLGDGDTSPDWNITGDVGRQLRAERSGTGNGRIYTITVGVTDMSGNTTRRSVEVAVPKSQS
jgi:hypothetical protein